MEPAQQQQLKVAGRVPRRIGFTVDLCLQRLKMEKSLEHVDATLMGLAIGPTRTFCTRMEREMDHMLAELANAEWVDSEQMEVVRIQAMAVKSIFAQIREHGRLYDEQSHPMIHSQGNDDPGKEQDLEPA